MHIFQGCLCVNKLEKSFTAEEIIRQRCQSHHPPFADFFFFRRTSGPSPGQPSASHQPAPISNFFDSATGPNWNPEPRTDERRRRPSSTLGLLVCTRSGACELELHSTSGGPADVWQVERRRYSKPFTRNRPDRHGAHCRRQGESEEGIQFL